jgi:excisionase family DNA binding protein
MRQGGDKMPNTYPKQYMTITELVEQTGLTRDYFKTIARAKGVPIVKTSKGGKIYFKTTELDAFMVEINARSQRRR